MKVHLQTWYNQWLADEIAAHPNKNPDDISSPQVHFVRDHIAGLVWSDIPYEKRPRTPDGDVVSAYVVGEHSSNSVRLACYSIERPDLGLQFVLRGNFHDWNISVITDRELSDRKVLEGFELDFSRAEDKKGFRQGDSWGYCYFQGFPDEFKFGPYSQNCKKFSLTISGQYSMYTFIWLIMRDLVKFS